MNRSTRALRAAILSHPARTTTVALLLVAALVGACDLTPSPERAPLPAPPLTCPPAPPCPTVELSEAPCPVSSAEDDGEDAVEADQGAPVVSASARRRARRGGRRSEGSAAPAASSSGAVDLNTASAAELEGLPGVGPRMAERIIAYRERRPFTDTRQLLRVKGIGPRTFARLAPLVRVGGG